MSERIRAFRNKFRGRAVSHDTSGALSHGNKPAPENDWGTRAMRLTYVLVATLTLSAVCPGQQRKSFWAAAAATGIATAADAYSTVDMIGPSHCPSEASSPWLYGLHPQPARTALTMGAQFALTTTASYFLKRKKLHIWKIPLWPAPMAYETAIHTGGAIFNWQHCR